jgi:DNA-binding winged helix-turn-helix (wHTH) protein
VTAPRFRFAEFVLSPRRRVLLRGGRPVPLIPKYFDLLVLLVSRRREAVAKATIFAEVWSDVVVSDGALAQAVRTLRRTLGDDPREPRFIRTVSRHGYQFACEDVAEEDDEAPLEAPSRGDRTAAPADLPDETLDQLIERFVTAARAGPGAAEDARDLAERLHLFGTDAALARVRARPDHAGLVALLREARWNVPRAGNVPLLGDAEAGPAALALVRMRLADARHAVARRWAGAALAGAGGGALTGALGGVALVLAPGSSAHPQSSVALAAIGALAGGVGAGGIAAGLASAEAVARSRRAVALTAASALAGAATGGLARVIAAALLAGLFGLRGLHLGGALDGLVLGAAIGAGYATSTPRGEGGGLAAPSGRARLLAVVAVGLSGAIAAALLAWSGHLLMGGLVHEVARASRDAELVLAPLGHLIGEPDFGPLSRLVVSAFEGGALGASLTWGLTRDIRTDASVVGR